MKVSIQLLLDNAASLVDLSVIPHDFSSVRDNVLQMEFNREIETLRYMLVDVTTFEEEFKRRCRWRETDTKYTLPFSDMPESMTNQLYWNIANLIFKPKNMEEIFKILLPHISTYLEVSLPSIIPEKNELMGLKEYVKHIEPVIKITGKLEALELSPGIEELTRYILSDTLLFYVNDIVNFSLTLHTKLERLLKISYPALTEKLYTHNGNLQLLASDIHILNNKGITPNTAILQLIQGLTLGGSRMTGNAFASKASVEAIARFFDYFDALPRDIRESLRELKGDGYTLHTIIEDEIKKGECVETTAAHLTLLIQYNRNNPVLNTAPAMTSVELGKLERKYRATREKSNLNTKKDAYLIPKFPSQLIKKVIQTIVPETAEELIILILNFPPDFYDAFWAHVRLKKPCNELNELARAINMDFFNVEQKKALAKATVRHYMRFNLDESILFWTAKTHDVLFLQEVLRSYPLDLLQNEVKQLDELGRTVLHIAATNVACLNIILALYPENQRLDAVKIASHSDQTVLHYAARNPAALNIILALYPENQRVAAVQCVDKSDRTVLYYAVANPDSLKAILALLSESQRLDLVKAVDRSDCTVLHDAADNPESLKIILALYPENQRVAAVQCVDKSDGAVLHYVVANPDSLKAILALLSKSQQLDLMKTVDRSDCTVLHYAADNPESLKIILALYPENQKLALLEKGDDCHSTALHYAVSNAESLTIILSLYPEDKRLEALKMVNSLGQMVLHYAIHNLASMKVILALLSDHQKLSLLKTSIGKQTILTILADNKNIVTDPFISDFISIYTYLAALEKPKNIIQGIYHFFSVKSEAYQLMVSLDEQDSFDKIKNQLIDYMSNKVNSPLVKGLLMKLALSDTGIEALKARWDKGYDLKEISGLNI